MNIKNPEIGQHVQITRNERVLRDNIKFFPHAIAELKKKHHIGLVKDIVFTPEGTFYIVTFTVHVHQARHALTVTLQREAIGYMGAT